MISKTSAAEIARKYVETLNASGQYDIRLAIRNEGPYDRDGYWLFSFDSEECVLNGAFPLLGTGNFAVSFDGVVSTPGDGSEIGDKMAEDLRRTYL